MESEISMEILIPVILSCHVAWYVDITISVKHW
jgi:hypothetical protein